MASLTLKNITKIYPHSDDTKKKKSKNKKIGKVNPIFYALARAFFHRSFTKKYNITYDNAIVKDIKGPAIVVGTHTCDQDHILSALTLYPIRPTYIVSEHFIRNKRTARLLTLMHVITKKMFTPDVTTIMNVLQAKKEDAVIVIFPEGRLSCYGHTLPVTDGTAELIKKLGVNLYSWKAEGAYLTFPKWRDKGEDRIGKINCSVKLLLSADEVREKDVCEIKSLTEAAILHDDELAMINWYSSQTVWDKFISPEDCVENCKGLTVTDISEVAATLKLHTVYFLNGTLKGESEDDDYE